MSHTADAQPAGDVATQAFAVNTRRPDGNNYPHGARNRATRGTKQAASSKPGRNAAAGSPAFSASHSTIHRIRVTSLKTGHSSQTSAFLPTPVQHVCRPPSAPMLNRFYLFYISVFSSPLFYLYLGYPSRHPLQPDRSPPFVRDFRPLIPAHGARRLHGRLDGQSPAVGLQKRH